jgi:hypothetical protein
MTPETLRCLQCGTYYHDDPLCGCAEVEKLRAEVEVAKDQARRRVKWFAWCQKEIGPHFPGGTHHDDNARAYILRLREEVATLREIADAAREYLDANVESTDWGARVSRAALDAALRKGGRS